MELILLLAMMLLASITTFRVSQRWYVQLALVWCAGFVLFGWAVGLSPTQMGLGSWVPGLLWGLGCILVVTVAMGLGVAIPRLHPLFADERARSSSGTDVAHKSLFEVPLGTVMLEEIAFRSVLLGLLSREFGTVAGVLGSALVFGLWHILPALEMHDAHTLTSRFGSGWGARLATVAATVAATAAAGVGFALLVVVSGSVLAPMGLHWATNGPGSVAAWLVGRRQARQDRRRRARQAFTGDGDGAGGATAPDAVAPRSEAPGGSGGEGPEPV